MTAHSAAAASRSTSACRRAVSAPFAASKTRLRGSSGVVVMHQIQAATTDSPTHSEPVMHKGIREIFEVVLRGLETVGSEDAERQQALARGADLDLGVHLRADAAVVAG